MKRGVISVYLLGQVEKGIPQSLDWSTNPYVLLFVLPSTGLTT